MPIDVSTYKNFYFGTGAEFYFISKFYLLGYEANKLTPDIGADFIVTNRARTVFRQETPNSLFVQVKSTFMREGKARFYVKKSELESLANDASTITIFCYFKPVIEPDPKSLAPDFTDTFWFEGEEASWMRQLYNDLRRSEIEGKEDLVTFKGFAIGYVWLNNVQLERALGECLFEDSKYPDTKMLTLVEAERGGSLSIYKWSENMCVGTIVPETQNIFYLMNKCASTSKLDQGAFMYEHL